MINHQSAINHLGLDPNSHIYPTFQPEIHSKIEKALNCDFQIELLKSRKLDLWSLPNYHPLYSEDEELVISTLAGTLLSLSMTLEGNMLTSLITSMLKFLTVSRTKQLMTL